MVDPLSLALPLALHEQPLGAYVDAVNLDRASHIELTVARDPKPSASPDTIVVTYQDLSCHGVTPTGQWQRLACETPPRRDACGLDFEVDLRFVDSVLQTRARGACPVLEGLWPAATAFVKVNPLAVALRSNLGEHGGSETEGVLGRVIDLSLGVDRQGALRTFGVGVQRALVALGLSPYVASTATALGPTGLDEITTGGLIAGAMRCISPGPGGEQGDAPACFAANAERFGASAVYRALARDQLILGETCAPAPVVPDPSEAPNVGATPDGGTLRAWDFDADGVVDHDEQYDAAGRMVLARDRVPLRDGTEAYALAPVWKQRFGASGEPVEVQKESYEFGRRSETWGYTHTADGHVATLDHLTGAKGAPDAVEQRWEGTWDADGWPVDLTFVDTGPTVTETRVYHVTRGGAGVVTLEAVVTRSDRPGSTTQPGSGGVWLDRLPRSLIAPKDEAGPPPFDLQRDTEGRLIRLAVDGGAETRWTYACDGGETPGCAATTVTMTCTDPGRKCRDRTFRCAE